MVDFYGYNPPFIGGIQNIMSRQEDIRLIKNDILQLLMTIPGERIYRPDFGVNLRNFVFEQITDDELEVLRSEIVFAVSTFEPRVTVDYVQIDREDDKNRVKVTVVSRLKRDPTKEVNVETYLANSG